MFSAAQPNLRPSGMVEKVKHASLVRLLEVAGRHGINGHSALAAALDESEQVITNWAKRGVSSVGAIKAQRIFGCSPLFWFPRVTNPYSGGSTVCWNSANPNLALDFFSGHIKHLV